MENYSALEQLSHPLFSEHQVSVYIKRDDLLHPYISGNKWRKLKYNIEHIKKEKLTGIVSFGGSYSNHIHALAYACKVNNIKSVGIIRGEIENQQNYTLRCAKQWGMQLVFVDRKTYRRRHDVQYLTELQHEYPEYFIVPEGGSNALAVNGVAEICQELNEQIEFDTLLTPVGSAGTLSGLIVGDKGQHQLLGIAVLKQAEYLNEEVVKLIDGVTDYHNWQILTDYHQGGYAKFSSEALEKLRQFSAFTQVPFEPIYSGKMILALLDLIEKQRFEKGHRIVLLHTGGLQGLAGLAEQNRIKSDEWPLPPELQAQ